MLDNSFPAHRFFIFFLIFFFREILEKMCSGDKVAHTNAIRSGQDQSTVARRAETTVAKRGGRGWKRERVRERERERG